MPFSNSLVFLRRSIYFAQKVLLTNGHVYQKPQIRYMSTSDPKSTDALTNNKNEFNGIIPLDQISVSYMSSSGPGGQHVNKTQSKVQIKFHIASATWIPEKLKPYLMEKESHRITKEGYFVIQSDKSRVQILNKADCLERIRRMIRERLAEMDKPETPTETVEKHRLNRIRENERRLALKHEKSMTKAYRLKPTVWDL